MSLLDAAAVDVLCNRVDELDVQLGGRIVIRHDPRALASAEWNASNRIVDSETNQELCKKENVLKKVILPIRASNEAIQIITVKMIIDVEGYSMMLNLLERVPEEKL